MVLPGVAVATHPFFDAFFGSPLFVPDGSPSLLQNLSMPVVSSAIMLPECMNVCSS